jgi:hypothetical protein
MAWGPSDECELASHVAAVGALMPAPPPGAPGPFRLSEPGALRRLVEEASFEVSIVGDAAAAFVYPDEPTALRGLLSAGPSVKAIAHSGEGAVRDATLESIAPYRREDGSYAFDNVWRFAIARRA